MIIPIRLFNISLAYNSKLTNNTNTLFTLLYYPYNIMRSFD